jgi:hypothetical protein
LVNRIIFFKKTAIGLYCIRYSISNGYTSTFSEMFIAVSDFIRSVDPD